MIAPDRKSAAAVIANFRQVAGERELRLHPLIPRLVDPDALERMGAQRMGEGASDGESRAGMGEGEG